MKFSQTNLNLYKAFLVVYETQNMSRAAEILGTTQPNITHNIKELERQLSVKLFFSSPRGVRPSKEADTLYGHVSVALGAVVNVENSVKEFNEQSFGCIRIGCPSHIAGSVLLGFFKHFCNTYPNISLDIYSESVESLIEMLKRQEIDVLILSSKSIQSLGADFQKTEIRNLEYDFFASPSFLEKYSLGTSPTLQQIRNLPIIVHRISARYRDMVNQYGLKSEHMIHTSTVELACKLVQEGLGIGCCLKDFLKAECESDRIATLKIKGLTAENRTLMCIHDKSITDKFALAFVRELENFFF